jgi:hypothetical protein
MHCQGVVTQAGWGSESVRALFGRREKVVKTRVRLRSVCGYKQALNFVMMIINYSL